MTIGTRVTPEERFEFSRWIKWMAIMSAVAAAAVLVAFRPDSPAWQWAVGFVIFYAVAWISPPVWLLAYIAERIAANYHKRHIAL